MALFGKPPVDILNHKGGPMLTEILIVSIGSGSAPKRNHKKAVLRPGYRRKRAGRGTRKRAPARERLEEELQAELELPFVNPFPCQTVDAGNRHKGAGVCNDMCDGIERIGIRK